MEDQQGHDGISEEVVHLPAPTAFPIVLALGLTFALAGLVTNVGIRFGPTPSTLRCRSKCRSSITQPFAPRSLISR
jgi:hypothetical protein